MGDLPKGIESGFAATILISILILLQKAMGVQPQFDLLAWLGKAAGSSDPIFIWMLHFIVGSVFWGLGFAVLSPHLFGPHWLRGAVFGVLAWLVMMLVFLPSAGLPVFASGMGPAIPAVAFGLHLVFGVVMGEVYHLLVHFFPGEVEEEQA